jgi:hypothetical protein
MIPNIHEYGTTYNWCTNKVRYWDFISLTETELQQKHSEMKVLGFRFSFHWQILVQVTLWHFSLVTKYRVSHLTVMIQTPKLQQTHLLHQESLLSHFLTFHLLHLKICKCLHHVTQPKLLDHFSYLQLQLSGMIHTIIVGHHEQPMGAIMCNQTLVPFITALTC